MNSNTRTRTVALAADFVVARANYAFPNDDPNNEPNWPATGGEDTCVPPIDPTIAPSDERPVDSAVSWLAVSGGEAQYVLLQCPTGS